MADQGGQPGAHAGAVPGPRAYGADRLGLHAVSFEGNQAHGDAPQSVFTRHLVAGLRDGSADLDGDGDITLDELYSYVHDRVVEEMPQQRPKKQDNVQGRTVIARNVNWDLPAYLRNAIVSPIANDRLGALDALARLHRIGNDEVRERALDEIRRLADDDSRTVSAAAAQHLTALEAHPAVPPLEADEAPPVEAPPALVEAPPVEPTPPLIVIPTGAAESHTTGRGEADGSRERVAESVGGDGLPLAKEAAAGDPAGSLPFGVPTRKLTASPTAQRRRLGLALRTLRQARGLTGEQVGERVERSASWIFRVEGGRIAIRGRDLRDLFDLYEVDDAARRTELLSMAEKGRARSWWSEYSGSISDAYATFIGFEDEATRFESYEPMVVPGLLQQESYARALVESGIPQLSKREVEDRVQVRLRRQEVLRRRDPLHLSLVLQESALHQRVGSTQIMLDQLRHLVEVARLPNVDLRILLDEHTRPIGGFHHFVVIYLESDVPDTVYVEDLAGGRFERAGSIRPYQETFERSIQLALDPFQSTTKIEFAMADHEA